MTWLVHNRILSPFAWTVLDAFTGCFAHERINRTFLLISLRAFDSFLRRTVICGAAAFAHDRRDGAVQGKYARGGD